MNFKLNSEANKSAVCAYINMLDLKKTKYSVSITKIREIRTFDQNRLYWLWIACICQETGNDKDDVHEYFKEYFLGYSEKNLFDGTVRHTASTTSLDTKQFTDYLEKIKTWASREFGIQLPEPKDAYFEAFYQEYKNYI